MLLTAQVVPEPEFFTLSNSGGTKCSSAYQLALAHLQQHHTARSTNIYLFHFSDGDNWLDDSEACRDLVTEESMEMLGTDRRMLYKFKQINMLLTYKTFLTVHGSAPNVEYVGGSLHPATPPDAQPSYRLIDLSRFYGLRRKVKGSGHLDRVFRFAPTSPCSPHLKWYWRHQGALVCWPRSSRVWGQNIRMLYSIRSYERALIDTSS